jgi:hypothetical protein
MFHLAWGTLAFAVAGGPTTVPFFGDPAIAISNSNVYPPNDMQLIGAAQIGTPITQVRFSSPSIRPTGIPYVRPQLGNSAVPINNTPWMDLRHSPFRVRGREEFNVQATATGAGRANTAVLLQDTRVPLPPGDIYAIRATGATAAVASTPTTTALTWADSLPTGTYAVVWADLISTTCQFFRLIFTGQTWRPGFSGMVTESMNQEAIWTPGSLGVWGMFNNISMPQCEILCSAADATQILYLYVVKVA